jgi:ribosomal-protein-alanine N-acetyltransferase
MILETSRLLIRPFLRSDLLAIRRIFDEAYGATVSEPFSTTEEQQSWLEWQTLNQEWSPKLHQPPYGDLAIALKGSNEVIGSVGYVPVLCPFGQIPEFKIAAETSECYTTEFGLFWLVEPKHQRQGYATEAARAMIDYAFTQLHLKRIVAMTEYSNIASQKVMRKIGMRITRNPLPSPSWLQLVGLLENKG